MLSSSSEHTFNSTLTIIALSIPFTHEKGKNTYTMKKKF